MINFKDIKIGSLYWFTRKVSYGTDVNGGILQPQTPFVALNLSKIIGARDWHKLKILTISGEICYVNIWKDTCNTIEEPVTNENL